MLEGHRPAEKAVIFSPFLLQQREGRVERECGGAREVKDRAYGGNRFHKHDGKEKRMKTS